MADGNESESVVGAVQPKKPWASPTVDEKDISAITLSGPGGTHDFDGGITTVS